MRLIGLMAFFDEEPRRLFESISDLARLGVTDLIALDGPYANFPHDRVLSRLTESGAIVAACSSYGISLTLQRPTSAWVGDEIVKRQRLLDLAHVIAGDEPAWLCIWDADWRVQEPFDPADIWPTNLARGVDVSICDDPSLDEPPEVAWYRMKMLMRFEPGMHMGAAHYRYVYPDGFEQWILPRRPEDEAPLSGVRVRHLKYQRNPARLEAQAAYYETREAQGLES